ncbi:MAG: MerR family transcriptional regulator [Planctomycetes bacterium]|nr:MerR family transcriptional regulator [Planctomycetota bacterium]MCB9908767.1 MerR family transcriptional regulator [Planctomycetota bacterium]MCB9912408.1 MerR family transcriptional regulator [Planctomycetota bacterium]HRV83134.1 MerR family transcriptional regulator [Planctomycetota bacterium]
MSSEHLKIGDFARLAGTNLRTLRYYEELGLLEPASRSSGGFRYYRPSDSHRVHLIQNLQHLGLQLEQIRDLICSRGEERKGWRSKIDTALEQQEQLIADKVRFLEQQRAEIAAARAKLAECSGCEMHPEQGNNFCQPCALTGLSLPSLLPALFR